MELINAILALRNRGWTKRRIPRELNVDRHTVQRYFRAESKSPRFRPPTQKRRRAEHRAVGRSRNPRRRPSKCDPHADAIRWKLEQGLTAQRIYQDLVGEAQFQGSYEAVKRFVQRLKAEAPVPIQRFEMQPGEEVQVDFGSGAPIVQADGKRRKTHVFRMVLSYSRKAFSQAVLRQDSAAPLPFAR